MRTNRERAMRAKADDRFAYCLILADKWDITSQARSDPCLFPDVYLHNQPFQEGPTT